MKYTNMMKLEFPGLSVNESFARAAVGFFACQLNPTMPELSELKTAVSEAVTNAIVHGYRDTVGVITMTARLAEKGRVIVTVRDYGCGIPDVDAAMQPLFTTGGEERSGMGFTVMQTFCDRVHVWSREGRGTKVTLEKSFAGKAYI